MLTRLRRPPEFVLRGAIFFEISRRAAVRIGLMRPRLLLAAAVLLLAAWLVSDLNCSTAPAPREAPRAASAQPASGPAPATPTRTPPPDVFASAVRPILLAHCAPCHEPGGVMYERLPFDHAEVIASHSAGVLKRIKAPDERAAIERWLATRS